MKNKELDEMLVRYLQLCEASRDSDIWSDEARKSILHYRLIKKKENHLLWICLPR